MSDIVLCPICHKDFHDPTLCSHSVTAVREFQEKRKRQSETRKTIRAEVMRDASCPMCNDGTKFNMSNCPHTVRDLIRFEINERLSEVLNKEVVKFDGLDILCENIVKYVNMADVDVKTVTLEVKAMITKYFEKGGM